MNFKKLSAIAFVSAAILAGASALEAKPSWNAYSSSMSINEEATDEVIAQVKEKFESNKNADYAKASLSLCKSTISLQQNNILNRFFRVFLDNT